MENTPRCVQEIILSKEEQKAIKLIYRRKKLTFKENKYTYDWRRKPTEAQDSKEKIGNKYVEDEVLNQLGEYQLITHDMHSYYLTDDGKRWIQNYRKERNGVLRDIGAILIALGSLVVSICALA